MRFLVFAGFIVVGLAVIGGGDDDQVADRPAATSASVASPSEQESDVTGVGGLADETAPGLRVAGAPVGFEYLPRPDRRPEPDLVAKVRAALVRLERSSWRAGPVSERVDMPWSKCVALDRFLDRVLGTGLIIVRTDIMRMERYAFSDEATLLMTCSRPDVAAVLTLSPT
ncbi:MAG: hypothetical protein RID91_16135 [Azospirillaceae bacterium]